MNKHQGLPQSIDTASEAGSLPPVSHDAFDLAALALCDAVAAGHVFDGLRPMVDWAAELALALRAGLARLDAELLPLCPASVTPAAVDAARTALCRAAADGRVPQSPSASLEQRVAELANALAAGVKSLAASPCP